MNPLSDIDPKLAVRRIRRNLTVSIAIAASFVLVGIVCALILPSPLEVGGDDGYELGKAMLVSLGKPFYGEFWNDQPPLYTAVCTVLLHCGRGDETLVRIFTICCAGLLIGAIVLIGSLRWSLTAGLVAGMILISGPYFLRLAFSTMVEIPVITLVCLSLVGFHLYDLYCKPIWLISSGVVFALALCIKFTALLLLPVIIVFRSENRWIKDWRDSASPPSKLGLIFWSAVVILVVSVCFLTFGASPEMIASHFSSGTRSTYYSGFGWFDFEENYHPLLSFIPVLWLLKRQSTDAISIAASVTVILGVLSIHRPYWYNYSLYVSLSAALIGGVCTEWLMRSWNRQQTRIVRLSLALCVGVFALAVIVLPRRMADEIQAFSRLPTLQDNRILLYLRQHPRPGALLTDRPIYMFHSGMLSEPTFSFFPPKRFASGDINPSEIVSHINKDRPVYVVLTYSFLSKYEAVLPVLRRYYSQCAEENGEALFVRNCVSI